MSNARNIASGAKFVDTAGDTMTGHLGIGGTATDSAWGDASYGNTEVSIDGGGGYGVLHLRGDGAGSTNTRYSIGVGDNIFYMAYDRAASAHRIQVNSSGHVTKPYQPMFDAYLAANSNHPSGTYNLSTGDSWATRANIGNHFSSGTFTAPVAGRYLFTANLTASGNVGAMSYMGLEFQLNGTRRNVHWWGKGGSTASYFAANNATIMNLAANDVVRLASEKAQATTIIGGALYTSFTGILLG